MDLFIGFLLGVMAMGIVMVFVLKDLEKKINKFIKRMK